ncbi:unnamed protein product [Rotaria sp. Silwood1]|nr:unnamed protein product [Rotaria sp. Silwood1]
MLNQALENTTLEYGALSYRTERVHHIRRESLKINTLGLLHRLWPQLVWVSTTIGDSCSLYKKEIKFYCGEKLYLINFSGYDTSEGDFTSLASVHTAEYFLSPTTAFFEFIKEEDMHHVQSKTLLTSEITSGHRYELVCITDSGLIRYRIGDVDTCTRFLSEADDAVLLAFKKTEIPRIPLISIAYRTGNLLSISGENTTEQHVMITLRQTVQKWKQHGIYVDINDFILYPKLDAFPARYVMFLELVHENSQHDNKVINQQQKILQNNEIMSEIEQQLCEANHIYKDHRDGDKLDPITCILVRTGTFSIFLNKILVNTHVSIVQIVPHRVLKNEEHIQFFYDSRIVNPN